jgi:hypothetical protein
MDSGDHRGELVKRIVLPSGKTIEVLRSSEPYQRLEDRPEPTLGRAPEPREEAADEIPAAADAQACTSDPHLCPECDSELVYPVAWTAAGDDRWRVELRCPNCERAESAVLGTDVAERFDEELERGAEKQMGDLARLTEANMLADLERFAAALRVDAILPADF